MRTDMKPFRAYHPSEIERSATLATFHGEDKILIFFLTKGALSYTIRICESRNPFKNLPDDPFWREFILNLFVQYQGEFHTRTEGNFPLSFTGIEYPRHYIRWYPWIKEWLNE